MKGFRIEAGQPGPEVKTWADWQAWRERENQRMLDVFVASLGAFLAEAHDLQIERIAHEAEGGTVH